MSGLAFERLFSMGAFDGLRSLRGQKLLSDESDTSSIVEIIKKLDSGAASLDYEAALELETIVPGTAPSDPPHGFYRECIASLVLTKQGSWAKSVRLGRELLLKQLSRDEHQCFRSARLLDSPPPDDVIEWWDTLSAQIRHAVDQEKMKQARVAEKLTVTHEIARLRGLGIDVTPRWISIEDNTVGYDVLSYDPGEHGLLNRLIEVKSTVASPLRFNVSRNEWDNANKYGGTYRFYIWNLAGKLPQLHVRTVEQVRMHIPTDREDGQWTNVLIPVGGN